MRLVVAAAILFSFRRASFCQQPRHGLKRRRAFALNWRNGQIKTANRCPWESHDWGALPITPLVQLLLSVLNKPSSESTTGPISNRSHGRLRLRRPRGRTSRAVMQFLPGVVERGAQTGPLPVSRREEPTPRRLSASSDVRALLAISTPWNDTQTVRF